MDWAIIFDYLWKALASLASAVIISLSTTIFKKVLEKFGEAKVKRFISTCVKAAEQLFPNKGTKTGTTKFNYVLEQLTKKYPKIITNDTTDTIKALIESEVFKVSEQTKQIAKEQQKEENSSSNIKIQ